jgi:hypothetical protein
LLIAHAYRDIINLLQHMIAAVRQRRSTVTMPELIAWMHTALVIERAQQMAGLTLRISQRKLQKLLPAPPNLKMLPPPQK